ncbi:MAG: toll/interleukin-1 receptor domain-containing protein [Bacteroidales bacterium]|nr:toll/interleukin-1 receptor domain-containing protein [Bacteroidales bacterium]
MEEKLYDVFISYSSKDQKLVEAMCHYLEERNLRCFVAYRDIPKGKDWAPYIEKGFEDSKVLVYVHTESSNKSLETTREINLAFEEGCVVIPFRVDSIKYGEGKRYRLNNVNWLDAFPGNPENYFGDLFDILKVHFPERIQQKEDEQARLDAEKAEAERIAREKAEAEERRREAERRERERRQREEDARRRREERERRKQKLKAWWERNKSKVWGILAAVAFIWIMIIAVDSCEREPEDKPTELQKQYLFKQYVAKAEAFDLEYVENPDKENLLDSVRHYYELALELEENSDIRNRLKGL